MDPPYYDNVMYAELSDFFYVWLKRTAGHVFPELFRRQLTDKENEAVANPAKFRGEKGARALAGQDYRERMAAIFAECRRVLKPDGIMTLMFTHKATGAWDALTKGLIESGFAITASWPINTEAEGSLHIKDKAAANSTIFLVCRPRAAGRSGSAGPNDPGEAGQEGADRLPDQVAPVRAPPDRIDRSEAGREDADRSPERIAPPRTPLDSVGRGGSEQDQDTARAPLQVREAPGIYEPTRQDAPDLYWEDVEPQVARAVRARVGEFQDAGIAGVDLYLASFGPALEEFSRHWPLKRGTPREPPAERRRRRQQVLLDEEEWDPYATTPEDALDARPARGEALASGTTDPSQGRRRSRSRDGVLRPSRGTPSGRPRSPTTKRSGSPAPSVSIWTMTSSTGLRRRKAATCICGTAPNARPKGHSDRPTVPRA